MGTSQPRLAQFGPAGCAPAPMLLLAAALTLVAGPAGGATDSSVMAGDALTTDAAVTDPAALVHPLDGTGTGPVNPGTVGEFPGADLPFGMIQWSPDTTPNAVQSGGGYDFSDTRINGFSLTHLSGTGCPSYQDVPILPTWVPVGAAPESASEPFSHQHESGGPGSLPGGARSGSEPHRREPRRDDADRDRQGHLPPGHRSPTCSSRWGAASTRCRPIRSASSAATRWRGRSPAASSAGPATTTRPLRGAIRAAVRRPRHLDRCGRRCRRRSCSGTSCGAYVSFDTDSPDVAKRTVTMKVALSFVSTSDALANLGAEDPGWSLTHVADQATARWNSVLGRIDAAGGTPAEEHTFYTALYHSLLAPNVVSDDNRRYMGSDGHVRDGRRRPRRRVRRLLGVGHLPERGPTDQPAQSVGVRRHGAVARRRRRPERLAAQVGHRGRGRVADERRLGRPDHR